MRAIQGVACGLIALAAFAEAAENAVRLGLPGKSWSVEFQAQGFEVAQNSASEERRLWSALNREQAITLSVVIERSTSKATREGCKEQLEKLVQQQGPEAPQFSQMQEFTRVGFSRLMDVHRMKVNVLQLYACAPRGDSYVQVQLSKLQFTPTPSDEKTLSAILESAKLEDVPEPAATESSGR